MKLRAAVLAVLALAGAGGCRTPTSITLTITTDARCADLKGIAITTGDRANGEVASPVTSTTQCTTLDDHTSRIGTLVVVPSASSDDEIAIRVVAGIDRSVEECSAASQYRGCIVARRLIRFQSHVELQLPIELHLDCKSVACDSTSTCVNAGCKSATVSDPACSGPDCLAGTDGATDSTPDGPVDASVESSGEVGSEASSEVSGETAGCAAGQKSCAGGCVHVDDPAYGCAPATCSPCDPSTHASYTCAGGTCTASGCAPGYKSCSGACVAPSPANGCDDAACRPCPSGSGTASCAAGKCALACNAGYKLCGGVCVSQNDPTYGCGASSCDASSCPPPGGGTLVCTGGACVVGSCSGGTKKCGSSCVPKDASNGCDAATCTPCGTGEICSGGVCTCVPEPKTTTCMKVACGPTTNNCGASVDCGNTCTPPASCGGGGTPNVCGCKASSPCNGTDCGTFTDSCGATVSCGCTGSNTCGGGGVPGKCGCTPISQSAACGASCGMSAPNGCGGNWSCGCPSTKPHCCIDLCVCSACACP